MWNWHWYGCDKDYQLDNFSMHQIFQMFERGIELERFRAAKIAQYVWGKPDPEPELENDGVDLAAKNKVYGSGRKVSR